MSLIIALIRALHVPYEGCLNVSCKVDSTTLVYFFICYLKVIVMLNGLEYINYRSPMVILGEKWLLPIYNGFARFFSEKFLTLQHDSIVDGLYTMKPTIILTILAAYNHYFGVIVDVHVMATFLLHMLYLYRKNPFKLLFLGISVLAFYKDQQLVFDGLSLTEMYYLTAMVYLILYFLPPDAVNLDLLWIFILMGAYLVYTIASGLAMNGPFCRTRTKEEYLEASWTAQVLAGYVLNQTLF